MQLYFGFGSLKRAFLLWVLSAPVLSFANSADFADPVDPDADVITSFRCWYDMGDVRPGQKMTRFCRVSLAFYNGGVRYQITPVINGASGSGIWNMVYLDEALFRLEYYAPPANALEAGFRYLQTAKISFPQWPSSPSFPVSATVVADDFSFPRGGRYLS